MFYFFKALLKIMLLIPFTIVFIPTSLFLTFVFFCESETPDQFKNKWRYAFNEMKSVYNFNR